MSHSKIESTTLPLFVSYLAFLSITYSICLYDRYTISLSLSLSLVAQTRKLLRYVTALESKLRSWSVYKIGPFSVRSICKRERLTSELLICASNCRQRSNLWTRLIRLSASTSETKQKKVYRVIIIMKTF